MKISHLVFALLLVLQTARSSAQCTPASTPYFEGFLNITANNQFPPCWAATNPSTSCLTFTPPGEAGFTYVTGTSDYFFSPGIQLVPGLVYRASINYKLSSPGSNWGSVGIYSTTAQSSLNLFQMVTSPPIIMNTNPAQLSATFAVMSPTVVYFAIGASGTGTNGAQYLKWDDFFISTPCNFPANQPTITIVANPTAICNSPGAQATLTASGADTYTWSGGGNGPVKYATTLTASYMVNGTRTLTTCSANKNIAIPILPTPNVFAFVDPNPVCSGQTFTASAFGANSYTWSNGKTTATFTDVVNSQLTYSVTGMNSQGCTRTNSVMLTVNFSPTANLVSSSPTICAGDQVTLTASGGPSFYWEIPQGSILGNQVFTEPQTNSYYTVMVKAGTCSDTASIQIYVTTCTGMDKYSVNTGDLTVFPNPATDILNISLSGKLCILFAVTGEEKLQFESTSEPLDISTLAPGIYFLTARDHGTCHTFKVIKQ